MKVRPFVPAYVDMVRDKRLIHTDVLVFGYLARFAMADCSKIIPSNHAIARHFGMDQKTVKRSVARLVEAGYLKRFERFNRSGKQLSNRYSVELLGGDTRDPGRGSSVTPPGGTPVTPLVLKKEVLDVETNVSTSEALKTQVQKDKGVFVARFMEVYQTIDDGRDPRYRLTPADYGAMKTKGIEFPDRLCIQMAISWLLKKGLNVSVRSVLNCWQSAKVEEDRVENGSQPETIPTYEVDDD
jgi:hypothetical protein